MERRVPKAFQLDLNGAKERPEVPSFCTLSHNPSPEILGTGKHLLCTKHQLTTQWKQKFPSELVNTRRARFVSIPPTSQWSTMLSFLKLLLVSLLDLPSRRTVKAPGDTRSTFPSVCCGFMKWGNPRQIFLNNLQWCPWATQSPTTSVGGTISATFTNGVQFVSSLAIFE